MPSSLKPGTRVLVTGVTGYVAAGVADQFLQAGYVVIGTSRNAVKAEAVNNYFVTKYGASKFQIFEAGDLSKPGVFDDAVKDVEVIAHVASPVVFTSEDPIRDVINPAIAGTLSILESAHKYGKNVKHVVVTSSLASVVTSAVEPGHVYTEADWNDAAFEGVKKLKERGEPLDPFYAYSASKNEAERAVWRFRDENKPSFTLTTILPSWVFGTILPPPTTKAAVDATSTAKLVINLFSGENQDPIHRQEPASFVNLVDVARAHVLAVEKAAIADGQRYLTTAGSFSNQEILDILRKAYPERQDIIAKGEPGNYKETTLPADGSKVTRELGLQYTGLEQTVLDTVENVKYLYKA